MTPSCRYTILPTIVVFIAAAALLCLSTLVNTGILVGLTHTLVNCSYNVSLSLCNDTENILCHTSGRLVTLYQENEAPSLIKWAVLLVAIETLKFLLLIGLSYALYRIYLHQLITDLMALYTTKTPTTTLDSLPPVRPHSDESDQSSINFDTTTEEDSL